MMSSLIILATGLALAFAAPRYAHPPLGKPTLASSSAIVTPSAHPATSWPIITLKIDNKKQHIGALTGPQLSTAITSLLETACPRNLIGNPCTNSTIPLSTLAIENTPIGNAIKAQPDAHTRLGLSIKGANFPYGYHGLREAMVAAVAGAYNVMVEDDKNCYHSSEGMGTRFCNVGNYVDVRVPADADEAFLRVGLDYEGDTAQGKFDCVAGLEKTARVLERLAADFARPLGVMTIGQEYVCIHKGVTRGE